MKIEFYLDYLCPKCYLQHKVIESLIESKQITTDMLIYRSYEMVDDHEFDQGLEFVDFIAKYKHLPKSMVTEFLRETNLEINLFPIHNVHKMAHLAKKMQMSYIYNKAVFKSMYEEHKDLSLIHELRELSLGIGLPEEEVNLVLTTDKFSDAVISNKENGVLKGVASLPFLRINQRIKLRGVQDEASILTALMKDTPTSDNEHCVGEHCSRKQIH